MQKHVKHILIQVLGWAFIALGIVGLFLPILQGVLFLFIGLVILSTEYAWAKNLLGKVRARFPKLSHTADQATERASAWMRRFSRQPE